MRLKHAVYAVASFAALFTGLACALIYLPYYSDNVGYEVISPKGKYKVQIMIPSAWGFYFRYNKQDPGFARLRDNNTDRLLGESKMVELSGNSQVSWPDKHVKFVSVGMDIAFSAQPE